MQRSVVEAEGREVDDAGSLGAGRRLKRRLPVHVEAVIVVVILESRTPVVVEGMMVVIVVVVMLGECVGAPGMCVEAIAAVVVVCEPACAWHHADREKQQQRERRPRTQDASPGHSRRLPRRCRGCYDGGTAE